MSSNPEQARNFNGSRAALRTRDWSGAIQRAIKQHKDPDVLRKIADKVIDLALDGDLNAIKEIGDRIDGKAIQQTELNVSGNATFSTMTNEQIMLAIKERLANPDVARAVGLPELTVVKQESVK